MSDIACLALSGRILEDHIGGFKDLDWKRVRAVLANCLQEPWEEGSPNYLKLQRLRVGNLDGCGAVVLVIQKVEVLFVRALQ